MQLLRLATAAGEVLHQARARFVSAWVVQIHGIAAYPTTFSEPTGQRLVALGLIEPHPDPARRALRSPTAVIGTVYVPTLAGRLLAVGTIARNPRKDRP